MEKIKFKGKLLKLSTRKTALPGGFVAHLEVITHPGAALIIPFVSKDKVILLRQFRPVIGEYLYELPAGTLNKGESPIACARREIIEETGYSADVVKLIGKIYPVPGYSTERIFIYKASRLHKTIRTPEEDEVIESLSVSRAEVRKLFIKGALIDAKTIAAFAMCKWL